MAQNTNKGICMISYLGLFFLVPMFSDRQNKDYRFHANQGFILFVSSVLLLLLLSLINLTLFNIGRLLVLGLMAYGMYNAYRGEQKRLPIIGNIDLIK